MTSRNLVEDDGRPNLKRPRFSNEIPTHEIIDQTRFHGFITTIRCP